MHQESAWEVWGTAIALDLSLFAVAYNVSVLPPIMPQLVREFGSSVGTVQGALVLLSLVTAAFSPTCENLSDRYGRKRVFLAGLGAFALGSVLVAVSPHIGVFIFVYSLWLGLATTPLVSAPWALMARLFDDAEALKKVATLLALSSVLGGLFGTLLGGLIASNFGWRWSFAPELVVLGAIAVLIRPLPALPRRETDPPDWWGGALSCSGLALVLFGISLGGEYGWWQPRRVMLLFGRPFPPLPLSVVPLLLVAGSICLGVFAFWERERSRRAADPLLQTGLWRKSAFVLGTMTAAVFAGLNAGVKFNLFQFLPALLGTSPVQTAIAVLPLPITSAIVLVLALKKIRLAERVAPRAAIQGGIACFGVGLLWMWGVVSPEMEAGDVLLPLAIAGVGAGVVLSQIGPLTLAIARPQEKAEASGIYRPMQYLGQAIGRGVLGSCLIASASIGIVDGLIARASRDVSPEQRQQAIAYLERAVHTFTRDEMRDLFASLPENLQSQLGPIVAAATVESMRFSLGVAIALVLVCLAMSMPLPLRAVERSPRTLPLSRRD